MITTGWLTAAEDVPASQHLRSVTAILAEGPTSREERDAERRAQAGAEAARGRAQDAEDIAATAAFRARVNGTPPRNVLAEAAAEPFRDREAAGRRRAAIEVLRQHGLADVITGGSSGCVMDANMGVLEPVCDQRARDAMDRQYEFERSEREAEARTRAVNGFRAQLDERLRARGLAPLGASRRPPGGETPEEAYRRACAEIGQPVGGQKLSYR